MPYLLFSQTKMAGNFWSAARLIASKSCEGVHVNARVCIRAAWHLSRSAGREVRESSAKFINESDGRNAHLALVGRAVTIERKGDAAVALVLVREREARTERGLRADDAVATEEVGIRLQSGSQYMCSVLGLW